MSRTRTVTGTYGSGQTECEVFVYDTINGNSWYVVEGSVNVNRTSEDIENGVDVEYLTNDDFFTASKPIHSEEELEEQVES